MTKQEIRKSASTVKKEIEMKAHAFAMANHEKTVSVSVSHHHDYNNEFFTISVTVLQGWKAVGGTKSLMLSSIYTTSDDIVNFLKEVDEVLNIKN